MSIYGTDRETLDTAITWLRQGHDVALVTVAKTWGSSPRPIGSLMVMRQDGTHFGSVSGGCVEEDLVERYRNGELDGTSVTMIDYGVNRDEASRLGLPCGGRLELLIETIENAQPLEILIEKISSGELIARRVCLNTGEVSLHTASGSDEFSYCNNTITKLFGPAWHLLLIGAGHLSYYVAQMALMLDYRVVVCDPRENYARAWQIDGAQLVTTMPDDAVRELADHERSVIVTLTHDPKLDDMALMEALTSNAFYVGALGSRRSNDSRRKRLAELGVMVHQLNRLHAPVGLHIGSRTPAEIAISIMAEITAARHGKDSTATHRVIAAA